MHAELLIYFPSSLLLSYKAAPIALFQEREINNHGILRERERALRFRKVSLSVSGFSRLLSWPRGFNAPSSRTWKWHLATVTKFK